MFRSSCEILSDDRVCKYVIERGESSLSYADVLQLWREDEGFRAFFVDILRESPAIAFRWETPPITRQTVERPFEFVLVDSPSLARSPNSTSFADFFTSDEEGIVVFDGLGGDATLIVPSPRGPATDYVHLAQFVREAPDWQVHALWRTVGATIEKKLRINQSG